jgi:hypothetical protein
MTRSDGARCNKRGAVTAALYAVTCSLCIVACVCFSAACTSTDDSSRARRTASLNPHAGASGEGGSIAGPVNTGGMAGSMLGRPSLDGEAPPCDIDTLLEVACQGCHAREPGELAPMALITRQDFEAPAMSDPTRNVAQLAALRLRDQHRPMPPPASRRLTEEELELLERYLSNPASESCAPEPDAGVAPIDDLGECYRFQAHDKPVPADTTPFQAPNGEHYACFWFAVPWPADAQAISLRSLDTAITHHWQLYRTSEPYVDGAITRNQPNCGIENRSVLGVYSHSEQREQRMPAGVGLLLPPPTQDNGILLEVHYYNPNETALDSAGVEICTAAQPRPNAADVTVLGSSIFELPAGQRTAIESSCAPGFEAPINVFRSYPHMHARGIAMDSTIMRADGRQELLLDVGFDFNNQRMLDTSAVLQPGDRIVTRCHYQNDGDQAVSSGFTSSDEMCNLFVYAWPAGALSSGLLNVVPGSCLW